MDVTLIGKRAQNIGREPEIFKTDGWRNGLRRDWLCFRHI